ncbi:MAG: DUF1353 domain-containing protein [Actinomycetota bacterium]|nr:DUF1353 domain-containing protein [Actinomycetota bacterium]
MQLNQVTADTFVVPTPFVYDDPEAFTILCDWIDRTFEPDERPTLAEIARAFFWCGHLAISGGAAAPPEPETGGNAPSTAAQQREATRMAVEVAAASGRADVDADPGAAETDLASVPRFLRWFEGPYGRHTLAAILHDQLIGDDANTGWLRSDRMADWLFHRMLRRSGVEPLKALAMYTAVVARTRFEAGGYRQVLLLVWGGLGVVAIPAAVIAAWAIATGRADVEVAGVGTTPSVLAGVATISAILGAPCWGTQWKLSFVAEAAGLLLLPAGLLAVTANGLYRGLAAVRRHVAG